MWSLYNKAKTYSRLPSELLRLGDEWMAYQFDNAVHMFGVAIENALYERVNVGSDKAPKYEPKYTLHQLLDQEFRLPAPQKPQKAQGGGLAALMGMKGVKVFKGQS